MVTLLLAQYGGLAKGTTLSPPCAKVQMALRFKGLDFDVFNCKTPGDVKKFNSRGRVPALKIDDEVFVDSGDILSEIDRRWPEPPLLPESAYDQARCRMIDDWAGEVLYFQCAYMRWMMPGSFAKLKEVYFSKLPFPLSKIAPILALRELKVRLKGQGTGLKPPETIRRDLGAGLEMLENLLEHSDFFCGDHITRADISVAALLDQFGSLVLPESLRFDFGKLPRLGAWLKRFHEVIPSAADSEVTLSAP